ncbi:MAG: AAA family ATPase [Planctomycetes bacterium]|nr:AAA family ATPase [Planctomycetota bacterium]
MPDTRIEDVVLAEAIQDDLVERVRDHDAYAEAVRNTGLLRGDRAAESLIMLFLGPPGTGKTMTARALACKTGRPLYRLRRPSSPWVDWEGWLQATASAARVAGGILFVDDGDLVMEAFHRGRMVLLNLLDRYPGIAILATHREDQVDPALRRRANLHVPFAR